MAGCSWYCGALAAWEFWAAALQRSVCLPGARLALAPESVGHMVERKELLGYGFQKHKE